MLRNNLHYALLAVVRRWRRNLLTVLAMLAGTTTIIMLVAMQNGIIFIMNRLSKKKETAEKGSEQA